MLDTDTKRKIDTARDILVGKVPDPKSQVEQITIALIYKFMDDMDLQSEELGGERSFFKGEFEKYAWRKIFDPRMGGFEILALYSEAIMKMNVNPNIPQLFRDIFKNAYLPYRDPETLKLFLKIINEFTYDHSERLGDAFEYLLSVLGSQGEAGQFRTPRHIIDFMVAIIDPEKDELILDPACGTAGFLISSYNHIIKNNTSNYDPAKDIRMFETKDLSLSEIVINSKNYTGDKLTPDERSRLANNIKGYDISPDMVRLSLVNMYLHGLHAPHIYEYDTLTSEDNWNEYADVILANPPFMSPKGGIRPHKRFSITSNRSEVLFVDYIAEHLTPNGRAAVIVPEGIIFQSGTAYKNLRKILVENYLIGVISLPAGVFQPYSGVKTSILWMDRTLAKKTDKILFAKIENDGFDLGAQRRPIKHNDLPGAFQRIIDYKKHIFNAKLIDFESEKNIFLVSRNEISSKGEYNLSAERFKLQEVRSNHLEWRSLWEIVEFMTDGNWIESKDQSESGIRLIQTGNIGIGEYKDNDEKARFISEDTFQRLNCTEVFPGDILISRLPDPVGRACQVPLLPTKLITAVDCTILRFDQTQIIPILFVYYTKSDKYYEEIKPFLTGSSRSRISRKNLESIKVPIPTLTIQEEIVAEIESYQKIIDGARQVVENYKPRIEIDPEWEMVELKDIIDDLETGVSVNSESRHINNGEIGILKTSSVTYGEFKPEEHKAILPDEMQRARCNPREDAIIISRMNTKELVGASAYIDKTYDYLFLPDRLWQTVITNPNVSVRFLQYIISSEGYREKISEICGGTSGSMKNISKSNFLSLSVPLPEIGKQKELVTQIEEEQDMIKSNVRLIGIYEQKIKDRIAKVWGE